MAPQRRQAQLQSMAEEPWPRGLWSALGGLPSLIKAAGTLLADASAQPLSLCIIQVNEVPGGTGPRGAGVDDPALAEAAACLRDLAAHLVPRPDTGLLFRLRAGEFALLLPGYDAGARRGVQRRIHDAAHNGAPVSRFVLRSGGATAPDDGTTLAALWLAADTRLLASQPGSPPAAVEQDGTAVLARHPETFVQLLDAFLERVEASDRLSDHYARLAYTDPLTGLPNQRAVTSLLHDWIRSAAPFALLLIDGDELRAYNQRFGYEGGNQMILNVSAALARAVPEGAVLARWLSGDEFVVLIPQGDPMAVAAALCDSVRAASRAWPIPVTVSVGVARFPEHGHDPDSLIRAASMANDEAKRRGKNRVVVAQPPC